MKYEFFVAKKYFLSSSRKHFIGTINLISIIGIAVGVASLLVTLSIFNGFANVSTDILLNVDPHIKIEFLKNLDDTKHKNIEKKISNFNEIKSYNFYIEKKCLVQSKNSTQVVFLKGTEKNFFNKLDIYKKKIPNNSLPKVYIGMNLADKIVAIIGDTLSLMLPNEIEKLFQTSLPESKEFLVSGIFKTKNIDYDANYIFILLDDAKSVFNLKNNGIEILLNDISKSNSVKEKLQIDNNIKISTWYDLHKSIYSMMNLEKWSSYIILSCIIGIAVFNLFTSLTIMIIKKKNDIGIFYALGSEKRSVKKIFTSIGFIIGCIGIFFGLFMGTIFILLQYFFHIIPLDSSVYIIDAIPIEVQWLDFILVIFVSLFLIGTSSYFAVSKFKEISISQILK